MEQDPRRLERPLLILCGWMDPGFAGLDLKRKFKRWTGDNRIHSVSFNITASMEECRKRAIQEAEKCFPSSEPEGIQEVDVIGVSMGGLVARYAAISPANATEQNILRIHRLFTISTPHQGAIRSNLPPLNQQMREMRKGSAFLKNLDAESAGALYSLIPYVRLGDLIVGAENAAPAGQNPWWVSCLSLTPAHSMAFQDPRILADIARRLRGEPSFTHEPAAPLPE